MDQYKTCSKCKATKLLEDFPRDKRLKSGRKASCKKCTYAQTNLWVQKNYKRKLEINKKYKANNPAKVRQAYDRWLADNKQKVADYQKAYKELNKATLKEKSAKYRADNKERIALKNKEYREANKLDKQQKDREWARKNPDKVKSRNQRRRALKKKVSVYQVSAKDIQKIMSKPCFYCGAKSEHLDHVIPLARGGLHSIGNLVASCQKCNLSKGQKFIVEWRH